MKVPAKIRIIYYNLVKHKDITDIEVGLYYLSLIKNGVMPKIKQMVRELYK